MSSAKTETGKKVTEWLTLVNPRVRAGLRSRLRSHALGEAIVERYAAARPQPLLQRPTAETRSLWVRESVRHSEHHAKTVRSCRCRCLLPRSSDSSCKPRCWNYRGRSAAR